MIQETTENPLESRVELAMQPAKCWIREYLEDKLPGHEDKKVILVKNPCYPNCDGYNLNCEGHQLNGFVTSELAYQMNNSFCTSEIGMLNFDPLQSTELERLRRFGANRNLRVKGSNEVPVAELYAIASMYSDPNLCAEKLDARLRSVYLEEYKLNGEKTCLLCEGHNKWKSKDNCYMPRKEHAEKR